MTAGNDTGFKRPVMPDFEGEDRRAAIRIKHLKGTTFDFSKWKFRNPESGDLMGWEEVRQNCLADQYPRLVWVRLLQQCFEYLPERVRLIGDDALLVVSELAQALEQRTHYVKELGRYADWLEKQNGLLVARASELEEANAFLEAKRENIELRARLDEQQRVMKNFFVAKQESQDCGQQKPDQVAVPEAVSRDPPKKGRGPAKTRLRFPGYGDRGDDGGGDEI